MVCALLERVRSNQGQVVDAAMVDGAAALMTIFHGAQQSGFWKDAVGTNMLDSGAPFYDAYECADGKYVAIGSIEPQFYAELIEKLGLDGEELPGQHDGARWPELRARFTKLFRSRTRAEWCEIMEGSDVCFAPVLTMAESREHRTRARAHRSSRSRASRSLGPRRASRVPMPWCRARPPRAAPTPTRCWATGASPTARSRACATRKRSADDAREQHALVLVGRSRSADARANSNVARRAVS
jgi:alpha-methylacyl-CoA racemase